MKTSSAAREVRAWLSFAFGTNRLWPLVKAFPSESHLLSLQNVNCVAAALAGPKVPLALALSLVAIKESVASYTCSRDPGLHSPDHSLFRHSVRCVSFTVWIKYICSGCILIIWPQGKEILVWTLNTFLSWSKSNYNLWSRDGRKGETRQGALSESSSGRGFQTCHVYPFPVLWAVMWQRSTAL